MTDRQKIAAGTLAGFLIAYAVGAFTAWDANPGSWPTIGRFFCMAFGCLASMICTVIAHISGEVA